MGWIIRQTVWLQDATTLAFNSDSDEITDDREKARLWRYTEPLQTLDGLTAEQAVREPEDGLIC